MSDLVDKVYRLMDKSPIRALSLIMALVVAGCVFWDPARFAARTSALSVWQGLLLIWAVCAGVVHGVGFRPQRLRWRAFFSPLLAFVILCAGLYYFFS
ncbi:cyd operon protein YbgE [Brenneria izbisi]|uniref:Cyd operon protein YbgE n=1 Tax=Brenneria izbisi TaxID=2939450 RepID=A0AA42C2V7_9GAMM|nr:cyd operon protein YbgE [Brenneria izbisi]MCV9877955.1 cyd operon protein YbgE [Brenneria izbisi]MCV9881481.1 cyd operon protein YbgE [Brenneria izbisi]